MAPNGAPWCQVLPGLVEQLEASNAALAATKATTSNAKTQASGAKSREQASSYKALDLEREAISLSLSHGLGRLTLARVRVLGAGHVPGRGQWRCVCPGNGPVGAPRADGCQGAGPAACGHGGGAPLAGGLSPPASSH